MKTIYINIQEILLCYHIFSKNTKTHIYSYFFFNWLFSYIFFIIYFQQISKILIQMHPKHFIHCKIRR